MAPADSLARFRKHVLDRVARGEVSVVEACRQAGISRQRFYQLRHRYIAYGEAGLRPKPHPPRPDRQLPAPLQDQVVALAIELPTLGPRAIADRLALERFGAVRVSASGVYSVLRRRGLGRRAARLAAAESLSASAGGPITERALREIRARERATVVHLGSDVVGADLFADTMYVGKLKGVGSVWQYSFVDGACSMAFGGDRSGRKTARRMAAILEAQVIPAYREAGIPIRRISTDGGPEFGRHFTRACQRLGIVHRRLPPAQPGPQRLRRALAGHLSARALPHRLPLPLLHPGRGRRRRLPGLASPLQLRAAAPRLPHPGSSPRRALLRSPTGAAPEERMESR